MNDKITISTHQLFALFPDDDAARSYLESRRWPQGVRCPVCDSERIGQHSPGFHRCNACDEAFTVRTGTVMERSKIPLQKWLHAMYLLVTSRKGISSLQLSKELSIRQASAWFLLQRLREACAGKLDALRGIVEIDETYVGGIEANKHESKKLRAGRGVDQMSKPQRELDRIADAVLAYRPKPKSKPARKRARKQRRIQRKSSG